ncbi:DUF1963 domain-containing protein [Dactylosporangium salmoneum]|uniref:DUF1963 domain-containing protein n=1 Tax=Dactylosporangium salmoneum TaxID=53361 RepID=UPI0031D41BCF
MRTDDELVALARDVFPAGVAERWLGLRRAAVGLVPLPVGDVRTPVVGHLGGEPELPNDVPWPEAGGGRPLYHVATVDLGALAPEAAAAAGVPAQGRLLFFVDEALFEDGADEDDEAEGPVPAAAARLVHVPAGRTVRRRSTPGRGNAYERTRLGARLVATAPGAHDAAVRRAFGAELDDPGHPLFGLPLARALADPEPDHRLGGHPQPLRGPVELDAAVAALGPGADVRLLAQFDRGDPDIAWHGDDGVLLYWLIRADDLAAARFDRAVFVLRRPYPNWE